MICRARPGMRRWSVLLLALLIACAGCAESAVAPPAVRPSIVFVLTDDLSWNLVQFMPHVQDLQKRGLTFSNYTVTDSLCCPSRASIFTGNFPHNTGVFTNTAPDGGFDLFFRRGEESQTFATALREIDYRTALMGKYLNDYNPRKSLGGPGPYIPPGWSEWIAPSAKGIEGFDYVQNENGKIVQYGHQPEDYVTDVLGRKSAAFIAQAAIDDVPFLIEVAPYAPHYPHTPAPRDSAAFPGLLAPRGPAYDRQNLAAPAWLAAQPPISADLQRTIDEDFRKRAQAVLAVDAMIGQLEEAVIKAGVASNTYFVFSSDNGYHMGEHRLPPGKQTAFETDVTVPLVVVGPGVPAGVVDDHLLQNIDLAPTFETLAGAAVPDSVDGHSFVSLLRGEDPGEWRTASLIEHRGVPMAVDDPDLPAQPAVLQVPTYAAIRTLEGTYVEYETGEIEYYDLRRDPDQLTNIAARLSSDQQAGLHETLEALVNCHGGEMCWAAAQGGS